MEMSAGSVDFRITSLCSVNQFPGLPRFVRFSSLGFIVDQSIFLLRKMDAFFFF
jgi:hypothetical protein